MKSRKCLRCKRSTETRASPSYGVSRRPSERQRITGLTREHHSIIIGEIEFKVCFQHPHDEGYQDWSRSDQVDRIRMFTNDFADQVRQLRV
jgi:hypothetical protein